MLVPELNLGQLSLVLNGRFPVRVIPMNKVQGRPFTVRELRRRIEELVS